MILHTFTLFCSTFGFFLTLEFQKFYKSFFLKKITNLIESGKNVGTHVVQILLVRFSAISGKDGGLSPLIIFLCLLHYSLPLTQCVAVSLNM